jgi:hypothetical protein
MKSAMETLAENRFARIEADLSVLKWMVGFNVVASGALLAMIFIGGH